MVLNAQSQSDLVSDCSKHPSNVSMCSLPDRQQHTEHLPSVVRSTAATERGKLSVQAHSSRHGGGGEQRRYEKACGICIIKAVKITFIRAMRMNPRRQNLERLSLKHCGGRGQTWAFAVISPLWAGARRTFLTLEAQGDRDQRILRSRSRS